MSKFMLDSVLGDAGSQVSVDSSSGRPHYQAYAIPLGILFVFLFVFVWSTWERWLPATPVEVVRVEAIKSAHAKNMQSTTQQVAFQAAGWIEPDPSLIRATALVSGVIQTVSVVEGQDVSAGQVLASLNPDDFAITLRAEQAAMDAVLADLEAALAGVAIAQSQQQTLQAQIQAQQARVDELRDQATRLLGAGSAISEGSRIQAQLRQQEAEAQLRALVSQESLYQSQIAQAEALVKQQRARQNQQQVRIDQAQLNYERTQIRAPTSGMVQKLYAVPGRKQMLGSDNPVSTTVAEIFDPSRIQVRVDVALADAGGLFVGQQARIETDLLPRRQFVGHVTRIEGHADLTRNTLQAKVQVLDPDPKMRPEMLCRVQFLSEKDEQSDAGAAASSSRLQLFIPASVPNARAHSTHQFWLVNSRSQLESVQVQFGSLFDQSVEIIAGVPAGAWLVTSPNAGLQVGQRVVVQGGK